MSITLTPRLKFVEGSTRPLGDRDGVQRVANGLRRGCVVDLVTKRLVPGRNRRNRRSRRSRGDPLTNLYTEEYS